MTDAMKVALVFAGGAALLAAGGVTGAFILRTPYQTLHLGRELTAVVDQRTGEVRYCLWEGCRKIGDIIKIGDGELMPQ